jgi:hypothetical protein
MSGKVETGFPADIARFVPRDKRQNRGGLGKAYRFDTAASRSCNCR